MAISDLALVTRPTLDEGALDDVAALVTEARWNQVTADWRIFLELGRVYAMQTSAGRIWRRRRTRSSIGGWVENRPAIPPPLNGLTM